MAPTPIPQFIVFVVLFHLHSPGVAAFYGNPYIHECAISDNHLWFSCGRNASKDITEQFISSDRVQCKKFANTELVDVTVENVQNVEFLNCEFETLPTDLFLKFTSLHAINTNRMGLTAFSVRNLPSDCSHLDTIELSLNHLKNIDLGLFEAIPALKHLKLSANQFEELPQFPATRQLKTLDLSTNVIRYIEEETFVGLSQLETLDLRDNRLKIAALHFGEKNELRRLDLSFNQISELHVGDFLHLQKLQELNIRYAQVSSIEVGTFAPLAKLEKLDLSHNRLGRIDFNVFTLSVPLLNTLELHGNQLTELGEKFDRLFPQLDQLLITDNQFNCTYLKGFLWTLRQRSHVVDKNPSVDIHPNIRGIACDDIAELSIGAQTPTQIQGGQGGGQQGFKSGYNVSMFILVLWISLMNLVICGVVVLVVRKSIVFQRN